MHDEGHISWPALQSDLSQQPQVQIHGGRSAARRALAAGREGLNIVNRYRILIVDDDAMAREILKRILEHAGDRKSTRLNSSHSQISYAVFCLKKKKKMTPDRDVVA